MARKGWDALSDAYRGRLLRGGVTRAGYESNLPLQGARGHGTQSTEAWMRRTREFGREYIKATWQPAERAHVVTKYVRSLGRAAGTQYMRESMENITLYEDGEIEQSHNFWVGRVDKRAIDFLYFYHGAFS